MTRLALQTLCGALCSLLIMGCACYKEPKKNLVYRADTGPEGMFDYYEPISGSGDRRPAIIAIHGGGWQGGDKSWGKQVAEEFCCRGYVVFSVNYRLAPASTWPAQIEDAQAALRYFRSTAKIWGIDPDRIGAFGQSAGGHLAAMLALRGPDRVAAAVTANGEGDLRVYGYEPIMANEDQLLSAILGGDPPFDPALLADLSPAFWAPGGNPVWVIHSTGDQNVYFDQGVRLNTALAQEGIETGITVISDDCHGKCWKERRALSDARDFFERHLGD